MNNPFSDRFARLYAMFAVTLVALGSGCQHAPPAPAAVIPAADEVRFAEVGAQAGLNYVWQAPGKRPLTILQTIGNGCAFLDYNGDGNLDILLVGPKPALFRGDGQGHFVDVTVETGLSAVTGHLLGCAVGDYDNDGYPDIYLSAYRGGMLLHNEGGRTFRDVTARAGLSSQPWGTSCSFVDLDNDGRLDLYISNYAKFDAKSPQLCDFGGKMSSCGPRDYSPEKGVVYRNLGDGRFKDVTALWGMRAVSGRDLGVAAADFDQSGRQSLAIANDEMPGDLMVWRDAKFANIGIDSGTAYDVSAAEHGGMGIDWGDYDNDGRLDLAVATFQHEAKCIYHNDSGRQFSERSRRLNIATPTLPYIAFGMKWVDVDNDGWLDLVLANGHVQDNINDIDRTLTYRQPSQLFRNIGGTRFDEIGNRACPAFGTPIVGRGLAVGDYDNDGKPDLLIVDSEGRPLLFHNVSGSRANWITVRLIGARSNRDGYGALVTVETSGRKLLRHCSADGSYLSSSDPRVHFGLADSAGPVTITIVWPSGKTDVLKGIAVNRIVTIREGGVVK